MKQLVTRLDALAILAGAAILVGVAFSLGAMIGWSALGVSLIALGAYEGR